MVSAKQTKLQIYRNIILNGELLKAFPKIINEMSMPLSLSSIQQYPGVTGQYNQAKRKANKKPTITGR